MSMKHVKRDGDRHPDMHSKTDANSKKKQGEIRRTNEEEKTETDS